ncbi:MAG: hypothetical protein J6C95_06305 [Muribaculaceae bacterium]|nr:hypothetical protein [Muribaculaceae bacterium]
MSRNTFFIAFLLLALPVIVAVAPHGRPTPPVIRPQIPTADRTVGNRVFLEQADKLHKETGDSFMTVVGNVIFTKGPMIMKCDSAHFFENSESLQAFGNISMEQGDTLFVYADELDYEGDTEIATLYADPGKKVRLINRDVMLQTDIFIYDLAIDLGYYEVGGTLTDPSNTLTSIYGEYVPSTKEANFYTDVHLNSRNQDDTLDIFSDTLYYNTDTHIAQLFSPSEVINQRGIIYTRLGVYDTDSNRTTLYDRSTIVTSQHHTLTADTIYYDRTAGYGQAWGGMVLTDSIHDAEVHGDYGFYNELADTAFITGRAMIKHFNGEDTLYLHGKFIRTAALYDTIQTPADTVAGKLAMAVVDTSHVAVVHPAVRFYRSDMQGVCDSLRFTERDSTLRMFVNPVVWSKDQQIFGNIIEMILNDSTIERAVLPDQAFAAQHIEGDHYQQLSGKEMIAKFEAGQLRRLDINGNVEVILYPEENDSTINKLMTVESSYLTAFFKGRATESVKMWPQSTGRATPLFLARKSQYYLPKFQWFEDRRPVDKNDIFRKEESPAPPGPESEPTEP